MKRAAILLFLLAGSCGVESWKYKSYPPNPFPDVRTVAVLPVQNGTLDGRFDGFEFGNILASELVKFDGFRVLRPVDFKKAMEAGEKITSLDDVLRVARKMKADALLVLQITDYDPYDPPRVAVSAQLLRAQARTLSSGDIDRIVQSASWRPGPLALTREKAGHLVAAFETVYDAHEERIRKELIAYAQAQEGSDSPFAPDREFMAVQARYLQFVSNQVINRLFEMSAPEE
jgi:hypothetical protein